MPAVNSQTVIFGTSALFSDSVGFANADVAESRQDVNSSPLGVSNASPSFSFFVSFPFCLFLSLSHSLPQLNMKVYNLFVFVILVLFLGFCDTLIL